MSHQTSWWPFSFLLRPFHRPCVYVPQPTAVPLIHCRITPSSWMISALVQSHAERKSACVSSTDHGHLAQYGCDGTDKEAGRGRQLVEPTSLCLPHPVVWLWIWGTKLLQIGQEGALYADRPHDIGSHNNGEKEQASAVPHVVTRGMNRIPLVGQTQSPGGCNCPERLSKMKGEISRRSCKSEPLILE